MSPKTLTSIAPRDLSTNLVRISRIAFERAFTSIAHIPSTTGGLRLSAAGEKSEWEPVEDGDEERVNTELERGESLSDAKRALRRDGLVSQCMDADMQIGVGRRAGMSLSLCNKLNYVISRAYVFT